MENGEKIDKLNKGIIDLTLALKDVQSSIDLDRLASKNNDEKLTEALDRLANIQEKHDIRIASLEGYNNNLEKQKSKAVGFFAGLGFVSGGLGAYLAKIIGVFH